jgi:hypothetical protein
MAIRFFEHEGRAHFEFIAPKVEAGTPPLILVGFVTDQHKADYKGEWTAFTELHPEFLTEAEKKKADEIAVLFANREAAKSEAPVVEKKKKAKS